MGREELFIQRFRDLLMHAKNGFSLLGSRMKYGREEKFIRPCHFRKGLRGETRYVRVQKKLFSFSFSKKSVKKVSKKRDFPIL